MIVPVVLCGGAGTRLWPLSRELTPKQLLALVGDRTMLEETLLRLAAVCDAPPILVCGDAHRFAVAEQARRAGVTPAAIVVEPVGRGTAPAATIAALVARALPASGAKDPILFVTPSDHHIGDLAGFVAAARAGIEQAAAGALVTFGVPALTPETGYGYIKREAGDGPRRVLAFVEKPDRRRAAAYVASGDYSWNSGMFVFGAGRWLHEIALHAPALLDACLAAYRGAAHDHDFVRLPAPFTCPADSIDCAVMEHTESAVVVPLAAAWSDVGAWDALADCLPADASGNATRGDAVLLDSTGCCVVADSRLVAAVGLENVIVVETPDAVLVVPRDRVQGVKGLVEMLRARGRAEVSSPRAVFRPWGKYDTLTEGEHFKVKRITVNPGGTLSLQYHTQRAEHWVVVHGTAHVTRGDAELELTPGQSTYIPVGMRHRIANRGETPLELIEVQSGSYLGEDDIVRLADDYGRIDATARAA